jgi:hypothetical protein
LQFPVGFSVRSSTERPSEVTGVAEQPMTRNIDTTTDDLIPDLKNICFILFCFIFWKKNSSALFVLFQENGLSAPATIASSYRLDENGPKTIKSLFAMSPVEQT